MGLQKGIYQDPVPWCRGREAEADEVWQLLKAEQCEWLSHIPSFSHILLGRRVSKSVLPSQPTDFQRRLSYLSYVRTGSSLREAQCLSQDRRGMDTKWPK